jgi:hypothetical protein
MLHRPSHKLPTPGFVLYKTKKPSKEGDFDGVVKCYLRRKKKIPERRAKIAVMIEKIYVPLTSSRPK